MLNWLRKRRRKSKSKTAEANHKPDMSLEHIYHEIEEIEENSCNSFSEGVDYVTPTSAYAIVSVLDGIKRLDNDVRQPKGMQKHDSRDSLQKTNIHSPGMPLPGIHVRENCHVCERLRETGFDCKGNITCTNSKKPSAVVERKIPRLGTSISSSVIRSRSFSEKHKHTVNIKSQCHSSTRLPDIAPRPQMSCLSRSFNENHRRKLTMPKQTTTHSTSALHHQRRPQPIGGPPSPLPKVEEIRKAERRSVDTLKTRMFHRDVQRDVFNNHRSSPQIASSPSRGISRSDSMSSASSGDTYFEYDASSSASSVSDSNYQQALWTVERNLKYKLDLNDTTKSSTEQRAPNNSNSNQDQRHRHADYENICPNKTCAKTKYKRSVSSKNATGCYLETQLFDHSHKTRRSLRTTRSPAKRTSPQGILRTHRGTNSSSRDKGSTHHVTSTLPRSQGSHISKSGVSRNQMLSDLIRMNHERQQFVFV